MRKMIPLTLVAALSGSVLFAPHALSESLTPSVEAPLAPLQEVSLPVYHGQNATLSDFKGQVLLVDFWASWCGPCRESFPWMTDIQAKYKDQGLTVLAINLDEEHDQALNFLNEYSPGFTVLFDTNAQLPEEFGVMGMPTSYLIDRNGKIRSSHIGFHKGNVADYEQAIATLLSEKGD